MIPICVPATKATTTQCLFESLFELRINKSVYNWIHKAPRERQVNTCCIKFLRNIKPKGPNDGDNGDLRPCYHKETGYGETRL